MQLSKIYNPQVHDLLQIDASLLTAGRIAQPSWAIDTLVSCPWVVVRRSQAPTGQVAIGVRGGTRSIRWGGFLKKNLISRIVRPPELVVLWRSSICSFRTPAMKALQQVVEAWRDLAFPWGPTGSVGFELASGHHVTTEVSDLDIAIRAHERISVEQARSLWERVIGLQTKVDIRVETPECGFSLEEYVKASSRPILLRYSDGVTLGEDPWSDGTPTAESTA